MNAGDFSTLLIRILRPVVRLLLRFGIPYKAASAALRWCYVDVATRDFAVEGKQTKARVAVITGLTRIEVERLQREPAPAAHDNARSHHRAARVLTGWSTDPVYLDLHGVPRLLPLEGAEPSFSGLVQAYSGGTTMRAVLDECLRVGAVVRETDDRLRLCNPDFIASGDAGQEQGIAIMGLSGNDLLGTIERNLRPGQTDTYFQRLVQQTGLRRSQVPAARQYLRRKALQLVEDVDLFLARLARDAREDPDDPQVERLGLGVYYFQDEPDPPPIEHDRRGRKQAPARAPSDAPVGAVRARTRTRRSSGESVS